MYVVILLIFFSNTLFAHETLLQQQFSTNDISPYLKSRVPFLQHGQSQPEDNVFTLNFAPKEQNYEYFTQVVGRSIFKSVFVVSWYVLTDVPSSVDKMMELVNQKKPIRFVSMTHINGKWQSKVSLPYSESLKKNATIVAYVSYPNTKGVLVPISAQVFHNTRQRTSDLSTDILDYWKKKSYL